MNDLIFNEFLIFTEIGFQKGAKNYFSGFFNFAWAGDCVGESDIPQMKDILIAHILILIWVFKMVCNIVKTRF